MENTQRIKQYEMNLKSFEEHPIWTWDEDIAFEDSEDWVCPIIGTNIPSEDFDTIFIKSEFVTNEGKKLLGYVIFNGVDVFAIGIYYKDEEFIFNANLKSDLENSLKRLKNLLGDEEKVFPIHYKTSVSYQGGELIEGKFQSK